MEKFKLTGMVTISVYTEVEADALEEAIKIAQERSIEKYAWSDKKQLESVWVNDDYDGEVFSIEQM